MPSETIEKLLGLSLPEDYKLFLTSHTKSGFDGDATYPLKEITPLGDSAVIDLLHTAEEIIKSEYFGFSSPRMLFIGDNLFGSSTCLCLEEDRFGHVYYYDIGGRSSWDDDTFRSMFPNLAPELKNYLETRRVGELPQKDEAFANFYLSATSFTDFYESIVIQDFEDE
mgnify:CR=1 FL=1